MKFLMLCGLALGLAIMTSPGIPSGFDTAKASAGTALPGQAAGRTSGGIGNRGGRGGGGTGGEPLTNRNSLAR